MLCQHLATPLKDAVEGDEGGLRGSLPPLGHLRRGGGGSLSPGSILPLRGTGDAASGLLAEKRHHRRCREPGNFAARVLVGRRPGSWIAEWMDRRVVRELSLLLVTLPPPNFAPPSSPFNSILERVVRCWHSNAYSSLFSSLFFDFHRTNFSRFRRTFHSFDPVGFAIFANPAPTQPNVATQQAKLRSTDSEWHSRPSLKFQPSDRKSLKP